MDEKPIPPLIPHLNNWASAMVNKNMDATTTNINFFITFGLG
jgi:hypothetical protein